MIVAVAVLDVPNLIAAIPTVAGALIAEVDGIAGFCCVKRLSRALTAYYKMWSVGTLPKWTLLEQILGAKRIEQ